MSQKQDEKINYQCKTCEVETQHFVLYIKNPTGFENDKNRNFKEFIYYLIKGWIFGAFLTSMDSVNRHLFCEICGAKTIEE